MSANLVLITGCSGGGKSTLLRELSGRGYSTVAEPGRSIVAEEQAGEGNALPWVDLTAFALRAVKMARADLAASENEPGLVFFDRGLVDAAVALQFAPGDGYRKTLGDKLHYSKTVFFAPPWPEIYSQDAERRHDIEAAVAECSRLDAALADLGYDICLLPKLPVRDRADFLLKTLGNA